MIICTVTPEFLERMSTLAIAVQPLFTEVMDMVMQEIEVMARSEYDWNPPGTVVTYPNGRQYSVTGGAIASITGFAVGADRDPYHEFSFTDPLTGDVHESQPGLNPPPDQIPGVVQGIITMTEPHAGYLQGWEQRGPSSTSPNLLGDGREITTDILERHETFIINAIGTEAEAALRRV
jgi:hypothetical protein